MKQKYACHLRQHPVVANSKTLSNILTLVEFFNHRAKRKINMSEV